MSILFLYTGMAFILCFDLKETTAFKVVVIAAIIGATIDLTWRQQ